MIALPFYANYLLCLFSLDMGLSAAGLAAAVSYHSWVHCFLHYLSANFHCDLWIMSEGGMDSYAPLGLVTGSCCFCLHSDSFFQVFFVPSKLI